MKRAGNHAVIDWLIRNSGFLSFHHLNNCTPRKAPYAGALSLFTGEEHHRRDAAFDPATLPPAEIVVASYEDLDLGQWIEGAPKHRLAWPHRQPLDIYIERSFLNWLPSYFRLWRNRGLKAPLDLCAKAFPAIRKWNRNHALCAAGPEGIYRIDFDRWGAEPSHRHEILSRLGFANLADDVSRVAPTGGGSSFDGLAFDGEAEAMPVRERWRTISDDGLLRQVVSLALEDAALRDLVRAQTPEALDALAPRLR
jgi:hypothetical protein